MPIDSAERARRYRKRRTEAGLKNVRGPNSKSGPRGSRGKARRQFDRDFIAWDGEGSTLEDGRHIYTLLANSSGEYIYSDNGLTTIACLSFLLDEAKRLGKNNYVCFGASYDVNMMLGDLPEKLLRCINEREETGFLYEGRYYWVSYRPRKYLRVMRSPSDIPYRRNIAGKWVRNYDAKITLWDVIGFFQCSFVNALSEYYAKDLEKLPELETIIAMKLQRSQFSASNAESVLAYCLEECRYLVLLMNRLRSHLATCGLFVDAWDGTGAVARFVMRLNNVRRYMKPPPEEVKEAIQCAYSGGRIESLKLGYYKGAVYDYDINSAYPSAQVDLPCLSCAFWVHTFSVPKTKHFISRVSFQFGDDHTWYPHFVRQLNGEIRYPSQGQGWYWAPEVMAAQAYYNNYRGPGTFYRILESWELHTGCEHRPFRFIAEQYKQRQDRKKRGDAAQMALKLSINSCYGKTMQQVGGTVEKPPAYFQLEWGGLITSATRARLIEAALTTKQDHIIFFATDGILTKSPLSIPTGEGMGEWTHKNTYEEALILLPGVYWLRKGDLVHTATRGFERPTDQDPFTFVRDAWRRELRELPLPSTRFVTLRSALVGKSLSENWRRWITSDRKMMLDGTSAKRKSYSGATGLLSDTLQDLQPQDNLRGNDLSEPYKVSFWTDFPDQKAKIEDEDLQEQDWA